MDLKTTRFPIPKIQTESETRGDGMTDISVRVREIESRIDKNEMALVNTQSDILRVEKRIKPIEDIIKDKDGLINKISIMGQQLDTLSSQIRVIVYLSVSSIFSIVVGVIVGFTLYIINKLG